MALNGYFGKPGSGKSYSVVEYVVIPALQKGRHVVTNIPLEADLLTQVYGGRITQLPLDALDDPQLPELIPHGAVAVIDECWRRWPSGQKVNKASVDDLQWLKEHRHRVDGEGNAMQVVLVTQDPADLAAWVRKLIAHSFHMHKLEEVGAAKRFGIKVYRGCPTGERIPEKLLIREAYGTYKPEIYQYYRSATQSQTLDVGDEKAMDKRVSVWGSWQMITILVFVPLALSIGGYLLYDYFASKLAPQKEVAEVVQEVPQPVAQAAPSHLVNPWPEDMLPAAPVPAQAQTVAAPVAVDPPLSGLWRIGGFIRRSDKPRDPNWQSIGGYNQPDVTDPQARENWAPDQVLLRSMFGTRRITMDQCKTYPDGVQVYCDVDGERVTAWSGQQTVSTIAPNVSSPGGGVAPSGERSDPAGATPAFQASRQPVRVTVVEDTSRTPRTLTAVPAGNQPAGNASL
ncbi:zonular occludens toxin domain-containing protein [Metapseudomonas sp. CR1201]